MKENLFYESRIPDEKLIWRVIDLKTGQHLTRERLKRPTLAFLLSGEMIVSTAPVTGQRMDGRQLFLIPTGNNIHVKAVTDISAITCSFDRNMDLYNRFPIELLHRYVDTDTPREEQQLTAHPINLGGKVLRFIRKVVPLHHEHSRTIIIGTVNTAIRDSFKF